MQHTFNLRVLSYLLMCSFLLLMVACSSVDDIASINELLTNRSQKSWRLVSKKYNTLENIEYCETDDIWTFSQGNNLSGTLVISTGFLRCDIAESSEQLNWFLGSLNQNTIYINLPPERAGISNEDLLRKGIIRSISTDVLEIEIQVLQDDYGAWTDVLLYQFESVL